MQLKSPYKGEWKRAASEKVASEIEPSEVEWSNDDWNMNGRNESEQQWREESEKKYKGENNERSEREGDCLALPFSRLFTSRPTNEERSDEWVREGR